MKRRNFIRNLSAATVVGTAVAGAGVATGAMLRSQEHSIKWRIASANRSSESFKQFLETAEAMTAGAIHFEVSDINSTEDAETLFTALSNGELQMLHGNILPHQPAPGLQLLSLIPHGLSQTEFNQWFYGEGKDAIDVLLKPDNILPLAIDNIGLERGVRANAFDKNFTDIAGSSGMSGSLGLLVGGWFNRKIVYGNEFQGLTMQVHGLGAQVLERLGGKAVQLPASDVITALKSGKIDAVAMSNLASDLEAGLADAADYFYYPGWHEPHTNMESLVNLSAFRELPVTLQVSLQSAVRAANQDSLTAQANANSEALTHIVSKTTVAQFPKALTYSLANESKRVVAQLSKNNTATDQLAVNYTSYRDRVRPAMLNTKNKA